jgi:hypothetical protein
MPAPYVVRGWTGKGCSKGKSSGGKGKSIAVKGKGKDSKGKSIAVKGEGKGDGKGERYVVEQQPGGVDAELPSPSTPPDAHVSGPIHPARLVMNICRDLLHTQQHQQRLLDRMDARHQTLRRQFDAVVAMLDRVLPLPGVSAGAGPLPPPQSGSSSGTPPSSDGHFAADF